MNGLKKEVNYSHSRGFQFWSQPYFIPWLDRRVGLGFESHVKVGIANP